MPGKTCRIASVKPSQPAAACWCRLEKHLPTGALQSGQGCLCPRCLREAIARAGAARG
ncbi:hypothetical protein [Ralstonia pseudosolanacearum]|uniref:hypothetical protein n=1 Tax=Ralstonia pseudosolanacearum TaxID=1310165 RepID=UPI003CF9315A